MSIYFSFAENAIKPFQSRRTEVSNTSSQTVMGWLQERFPGFVEFERPTVCVVRHGDASVEPLLRRDWSRPLTDGDMVFFIPVPQGPVVMLIVMVVISVGVGLLMRQNIEPPATNSQPEADPVFSLQGQRNQVRLGQPIEQPYGRVRTYPSLAAAAYNAYQNNEQWLYQLFCLGEGEFTVEGTYIEDTLTDEFSDMEVEIVPPGGLVTLFPDNVYTSAAVGNMELFAPNEQEFEVAGPFTSTPAGKQCTRIELDVVLPRGLYFSNDAGGLDERSAAMRVEAQEVDDYGNPIGSWFVLGTEIWSQATVTPQRYTLSYPVNSGRYQVRAQRTNNKDESHRAGNELRWETLRSFLPSTVSYGNVTMIAMRARASNNLNNSSASRFNVVAVRNIPVWDSLSKTWTANMPTRNPAYVFCDILRQEGVDLSFVDMDVIERMAAHCSANDDWFDWVYDQRTTVWEALRLCCQSFRATPVLNGSLISIVRDEPQSLPLMLFTPENMVANSFRREVKPPAPDEFNGLEVTYIDADTWKEETVICAIDGEAGDHCEQMRIEGITSRTKAYHAGMYKRACIKYLRENVRFSTGMEGQIPFFGDVVSIAYDRARWGQFGVVLQLTALGGSRWQAVLSNEVTFTEGKTHKISMRGDNGEASVPMDVDYQDTPSAVIAFTVPAGWTRPAMRDDTEPVTFQFGATSPFGMLAKVRAITPNGDGTVEVACSNVDDRVYLADTFDPPALGDVTGTLPPEAALPVVRNVSVTSYPVNPNTVIVAWKAATGATEYRVQMSYDQIAWTDVGVTQTTSLTFQCLPKTITVRVCGINSGAGAWSYWGPDMAPIDYVAGEPGIGETPGVATGASFKLTAGVAAIGAEWTFPNGGAISRTNLFISETAVRPATPLAAIIAPTNVYAFMGLQLETKYYVWVQFEGVPRAGETTAPLGAYAGPFEVTTGDIDTTPAPGSITADMLSVFELSAISARVGVLRTATSGARLEIRGTQILVYDGVSPYPRVELGIFGSV